MQCAVCDGVTIGHACCGVHGCHSPLPTNRHRFCEKHSHLNDGSALLFESQGLVLAEILSIAHWRGHITKRIKLFRGYNRVQSGPLFLILLFLLTTNLLNMDGDGVAGASCDGKPEVGNPKLKTYFSRRRTHNEQLIMRPCGVMLSRASFFGSEAVSALFAKATFPTPASTPEYFIFDNSCKLHAHLQHLGDTHFRDTGMPADVFHFDAKHKDSDHHCQLHCNPASFPELIQDGKWRINMSICEQSNVWLSLASQSSHDPE
ncbi:hypothetical protein CVT26_006518, partial [Gymnopilus dilepis]